jgi:hypothetical protein
MPNEYIEYLTAQRIREYEAKTGVTVKFPVPPRRSSSRS